MIVFGTAHQLRLEASIGSVQVVGISLPVVPVLRRRTGITTHVRRLRHLSQVVQLRFLGVSTRSSSSDSARVSLLPA